MKKQMIVQPWEKNNLRGGKQLLCGEWLIFLLMNETGLGVGHCYTRVIYWFRNWGLNYSVFEAKQSEVWFLGIKITFCKFYLPYLFIN